MNSKGFLRREAYSLEKFLVIASCLLFEFFSSAQAPDGYTLVRTDAEVHGNHKYENFSVYREALATRHWQHPTNPNRTREDTVPSWKDDTIQGHEGRTIVHAVPFRAQNAFIPRDQRANYEGLYRFLSDLDTAQRIFTAPLFYRPQGSNHIYSVKVTQQQWERVDHTTVDFLIVSYNSQDTLKFVDVASTTGGLILNAHLPDPGLYELTAADNDAHSAQQPPAGRGSQRAQAAQWTGRREKWKHLESNVATAESTIEIRAPHGILSIPGTGMFSLIEKGAETDGDVAQLKRDMESAQNDLDQILRGAVNVGGTVLVTGPTGCGKTTFINCYANNRCVSRLKKNGTGWELYFPAPIANLAVGHGGSSQTDRPALYPDQANRIALCDTPGDNDTNGKLKQIVNAYMVYRMFSNPSGVKLLLVIDESKINTDRYIGFIEALDDVVNSCPEDATLHQMIHLMISKYRSLETQTFLSSLLGDPHAVPAEPQHDLLNGKPRLVNFIRFLSTHPERLSTFAEAPIGERGQEIPFQPDLSEARTSILSGPVVVNPRVSIKLKDDCNQLIEGLARRLNEDMIRYLRTEGAQKILSYCLEITEGHNSSVADLRNQLLSLANRLRSILLSASPDEFVTVFDGSEERVGVQAVPQIFDAQGMKNIVNNLKFLKNILPGNVSYNIRGWINALSSTIPFENTIGKIEHLANGPHITFDNGTLLARGILVGSSDVESYISQRSISPAYIVIQALHTWFIDQGMIHHANAGNKTSVSAIAPRWKVTAGEKAIDLSGDVGSKGVQGAAGTKGTKGGDGEPGKPGYNAGSFFGKLFYGANLSGLTIQSNGGRGGDGGNGGKGGAGKSAADGQVDSMRITRDYGFDLVVPYGGKTNETPWSHSRWVLFTDVDRRRRETIALEKWIGADLFHHQIEVFGHPYDMEHAPVGEPGKTGGKGGLPGLGGNAGDIVIHGQDSATIAQESNAGLAGANNGTAGDGGEGGKNGKVLRGTIWKECRTGMHETRYLADRWENGPALSDPSVARAPSGNSPTELNETTPDNPAPEITLDQAAQDRSVSTYLTYYRDQSKDALASFFIKSFPGLEQ